MARRWRRIDSRRIVSPLRETIPIFEWARQVNVQSVSESETRAVVLQFIARCRSDLGIDYSAHIPKVSFELSIALPSIGSGLGNLHVCDLGAGLGLFGVACAEAGVGAVTIVDDFGDSAPTEHSRQLLAYFEKRGIRIERRDVLERGIDDLPAPDVLTSFASIEHWHHSPKRVLHSALDRMPSGARVVICTPNSLNLRKRLTVPFGVGKWSSMADYYEQPVFRGRVREPDVDDLRYIGRDLALRNATVFGRNWTGYGSKYWFARLGTRLFDRVLQLRPSLCADIYLVGDK